ncbi:site-specific integrase, partial [Vibrio cholerae]|uniref:site-specific integrase n=1 Tax=Vibrio cholerae TaxID=666 RepID=UPI0020CC420B
GLVEQFLDTMWFERGLAENTVASYRNDLSKLLEWSQTIFLHLAAVLSLMELSSLGYSTNAQLLNQNFYIDHLHCHPFV